MTAPLLEVANVSKRFGGLVANSDVSMSVAKGEILGLIGPNGAGKSTLFNAIAGAFGVDQGTIRFEGRDITRLDGPARCRLGIARTFQVPRSFESMSVAENVLVGALARHPAARAARAAALATLDFVGLGARASEPVGLLTPPER